MDRRVASLLAMTLAWFCEAVGDRAVIARPQAVAIHDFLRAGLPRRYRTSQ